MTPHLLSAQKAVLFSVVFSIFFLLAKPIAAQDKDCSIPPTHEGPFSSSMADPAVDCSTFEVVLDDPKGRDYWDNAQVMCAANAKQLYRVTKGEELLPIIDALGIRVPIDGSSSMAMNFVNNFGFSYTLEAANAGMFSPVGRRFITYDNFYDTGSTNAACLYMGFTNLEDCSNYYQEQIPTADNWTNFMRWGNTLERVMSVEERLRSLRNACQETIMPCYNGSAPDDVWCSHVYYVDAGQTDVAELCGSVPDTVEEYMDLSDQRKVELMAIEYLKTLLPAWLVIAPNINLDYQGPGVYLLELFFREHLDIKVKKFYIPGLYGLLNQGSETMLRMQLMPEAGDDSIEEIEEITYNPLQVGGGCSLINKNNPIQVFEATEPEAWLAVDKVNNSCLDCEGYQVEDSQYYVGAHEPYGDTGINIGYSLLGAVLSIYEFLENQIFHYSAWFVVPAETVRLDQQQALHNNAPNRAIYMPAIQSQIYYQEDIPQNFTPNTGSGNGEVAIGEDECSIFNILDCLFRVEGQGSAEPHTTFPGGNPAIDRYLKVYNPLTALTEVRNRFRTACYFKDIMQLAPQKDLTIMASVVTAVGGGGLGAFCPDDSRYQALFGTAGTPPTGPCEVKQHLFEPTCGSTCYDYILSQTLSNSSCNGEVMNPYYAIAIALNENGGLVSELPSGEANNHFGCDLAGAAGYDYTIQSKTECMLNTLTNDCLAGKSDAEALAEYGYSSGYNISPMAVLNAQSYDLFISPGQASAYANALRSLLPTQVDLWFDYYCPGYIQPYAAEHCPEQNLQCN